MSAADFLLSPAVQTLLKCVFAEPARQFSIPDIAQAAKTEVAELEQILQHLLDNGVLARGSPTDHGAETFGANTAFVFYPELRRIALKSFAAAEPLRAMLRSKFRGSVLRAFSLGEEPASGTLGLLLVHGEVVPEKETLDLALKKLLKTGAIRQHVQAHVMSERHFEALKPGDLLHAQLSADTCVDISLAGVRKAKSPPAPTSLFEKARRRLSRFGGRGG